MNIKKYVKFKTNLRLHLRIMTPLVTKLVHLNSNSNYDNRIIFLFHRGQDQEL